MLKQVLPEVNVLDLERNPTMDDGGICVENGSRIKTGRGMDSFHTPGSWLCIGANALALRPCLETKADTLGRG